MATFVNPVIATASLADDPRATGRVGFLVSRPELGVEYEEYRTPGTLWAYYRATDGYAELYMADPSGYKFMAIR